MLRHSQAEQIEMLHNIVDLLGPADFPLSDPQAPQETEGEASRLDAVEKAAIVRALEKHGKNVSRTAEALGLTRTSLYRRMEKFGIAKG